MSNYAGAAVRLYEQQRLGEAELLDILARIEACATKAGEGLDEIRALTRHRNAPAAPVNLNQAVDTCLQFLSDRIERLGVAVDRRYATALPTLMGDPIELSHVLIQLVSGSLEALADIKAAERRLSVGTSRDPERGVVLIEVADSRCRVHPELERQLFEPLPAERLNATAFGLSIAKAIVNTYEGAICMKKGNLGGLCFCVELPVEREKVG
jgi:C4-dicarboxylate-specific signal transduction histidine kinase